MRVLLVGGTGFLGRQLLEALEQTGVEAIPASRNAANGVVLDVRNSERCRQVLRDGEYDVVVNLSADGMSTVSESTDTLETNSVGPLNLAMAAASLGTWAPMLVHVASSTEIPNTSGLYESDYARTKAIGTELFRRAVEEQDLAARLVRVHNTYGPNQPENRFVMSTIVALKQGQIPNLRNPKRIRDFVYIEDVQQHLKALVLERVEGSDYHVVGSGVGTALWEIVQMTAEEYQVPLQASLALVDGAQDDFAERVADLHSEHLLRCDTTVGEGIQRTMSESA